MVLNFATPKNTLNKSYLKVKPKRTDIESFKINLTELINQIDDKEHEEFHKNALSRFLEKTYYSPYFYLNTKLRNDLVIHNGKDSKTPVAVIIEAKSPTNVQEMPRKDSINSKALQELLLYYLRERITLQNIHIKHLIITNINEWYIFDALVFERAFAQNKELVRQFKDFEEGRLVGTDTAFFYKEIAKPHIDSWTSSVSDKKSSLFTYFDLRTFLRIISNEDIAADNKLIPLYKILSPEHLLKLPFQNDSNILDKGFYTELLHIIGLYEIKDGSKKLIVRKSENDRDSASLIELALSKIESLNKMSRVSSSARVGNDLDEQTFNVALELAITWINRILFLKLLEAQLLTYHKADKAYAFLNKNRVASFDELDSLFFEVLACKPKDRLADIGKRFLTVPYLNSSLFEPTELEHQCFSIAQLPEKDLTILSSTVLKNNNGKKLTGKIGTLDYIFSFLDSYDFSSEGSEEIQEENKTLINASVLGLIFEKINGYRDGSFFTPGFVTMYMCRESLRRTVVQKFNEEKQWNCSSITDLYNLIEDKTEANEIINSIKICDPAVGSGHFLVSALNEFIAIKSELNILMDRHGKVLRDNSIEISSDELVILDEDGGLFEYNYRNKNSQRIQEAIFHEKQTLIEKCLFGVDINPNSVKICRLRLWIELLKSSYYKGKEDDFELETLPNIDINILCGNSLVSRFQPSDKKSKSLKKANFTVKEYREAVQSYQHASSKEHKREMEALISNIKSSFKTEISANDPKVIKLTKLQYDLNQIGGTDELFDLTKIEQKARTEKRKLLEKEIDKLSTKISDIQKNKIYENSFEWSLEFPSVLSDDGNFRGFDLIIGNPPYIYRNFNYTPYKDYFSETYKSTEGNFDLYKLFIESIGHILRNGGYASFIVPNTFLSAKTYSKLRAELMDKFIMQEIYDLGLHVFEGVVVENIAFIMQKSNTNTVSDTMVKIDRRRIKDLDHPEDEYSLSLQDLYKKEKTFNIYLESDVETLINKIRVETLPLRDIAYSTVGINTGYIKDELFAKSRIDDSYHKVLNGKDIAPFSINWKGEWIKYDKAFVDSFGDRGRALPPEYIFTEPKILVQRTRRGMKRKLVCTLDVNQFYNLNRLSNITLLDQEYSLKYLLALLNSKLMDYYFNKVFNEYEVKPHHLAMLPVKKPSKQENDLLIKIVDKILETKISDSKADVAGLELEMDKIIYNLYGLTPEDIEVVEA